MYQLTDFDGITLPNYDTVSDIGTGEHRTRVHELPEGGAYDDMGGTEEAMPGATLITKSCTAHYDTESALLSYMLTLRAKAGARGLLTRNLLATPSVNQRCIARLQKIDMSRKSGDKFTLDMVLYFLKLSPVWSSTNLNSVQQTLTAGSGVQNNLNWTNGGNAHVDNAVLTLTAGSTSITNVVIKNGTAFDTYNHLVYSGTIASGQALVIDCGYYTVKKNGVDDYANFSFGAEHKQVPWFRLFAGVNTVRVTLTGGGTNSTLLITFSDGWK